jgi:hypothetical protein
MFGLLVINTNTFTLSLFSTTSTASIFLFVSVLSAQLNKVLPIVMNSANKTFCDTEFAYKAVLGFEW